MNRLYIRVSAHLIGLIPLLWYASTLWHHGWPLDPVASYTAASGSAALQLLVASLAVTPLQRLSGRSALGVMRRPLGLYAFAYTMAHLLVYVMLDYAWNWSQISQNVFDKRHLIAGLIATALLIPLALTSTTGWQKRLGRWWKRLHRIVYGAAGLAVLHYVWLVKSDTRIPYVYATIIGILLLMRLLPLRRVFHAQSR